MVALVLSTEKTLDLAYTEDVSEGRLMDCTY